MKIPYTVYINGTFKNFTLLGFYLLLEFHRLLHATLHFSDNLHITGKSYVTGIDRYFTLLRGVPKYLEYSEYSFLS